MTCSLNRFVLGDGAHVTTGGADGLVVRVSIDGAPRDAVTFGGGAEEAASATAPGHVIAGVKALAVDCSLGTITEASAFIQR